MLRLLHDLMETSMPGIYVSILRHPHGDCTNGGVTSHDRMKRTRYGMAILLDVPGGDIRDQDIGRDDVVLTFERRGTRIVCVPCPLHHQRPAHKIYGPMTGGNFAYSTDDRFQKLFGSSPLAVHDRFETLEQYNANFD